MAFPPKLLNDNEAVILDLRPHWWYLVRQALAVIVSVVIIAVVLSQSWSGTPGTVANLAALALVLVALVWFGFRYLKWATTNFVVTTDRLIFRSGVISKQGREIPLERLNDIGFHQSVLERMLGAGDLLIESAGERGQETFNTIPHPAKVQNEIYRQIESARGRDADRMAGRHELSVAEQLEKLDELRQRGVISQAEFDAKKAQLLDRM